jgi:hypothetical protein
VVYYLNSQSKYITSLLFFGSAFTRLEEKGMNALKQKKPYISTQRELRFLVQLFSGRTPIHDLRNIAGAENIWQLCTDMKNKGWLIYTIREQFIDRDKRKVSSGYYELDASQNTLAIEAINAWKVKVASKEVA